MLKFLVDEDCPKGLESLLQSRGFDAAHVVTVGLSGSKDAQLAELAKQQERIIISRDLGFAHLLNYPLGSHPGIIVMRLPYEFTAPQIVSRFDKFLTGIESRRIRLEGALVILDNRQYRLRLPQKPD